METKISYFYVTQTDNETPISLYVSNQDERDFTISPRFGIINADRGLTYTFNFQVLVTDDPNKLIPEKGIISGKQNLNLKSNNDDFVIEQLRIPVTGLLTFRITLNLFENDRSIDKRVVYLRTKI
jgi:hypothetical protein